MIICAEQCAEGLFVHCGHRPKHSILRQELRTGICPSAPLLLSGRLKTHNYMISISWIPLFVNLEQTNTFLLWKCSLNASFYNILTYKLWNKNIRQNPKKTAYRDHIFIYSKSASKCSSVLIENCVSLCCRRIAILGLKGH